jgi:hypothetical protein
MNFASVVGIGHSVGIFVCWFTLYRRSGLAEVKAQAGVNWREFLIPNIAFFLLMWGKCLFWEATMIAWLLGGQHPSRWHAAIEDDSGRPIRTIRRLTT